MKNLVISNKQLVSIKKNLIEGLTIASGAKSSATYYHSKDDQTKAIKEAILKLYNQSKELPLILANQKGSTGKFIQEVLINEFSKTYMGGSCNIVNPIDWYDNGLSDKAVLGALYNLNENGIPYVLRLFTDLKNFGVNNERTRKILLGYIWGHPNIEFNVLKYRNKIQKTLKHVYGIRRSSILISIGENYLRNGGVFRSENERNIVYNLIGKFDLSSDTTRAFKLLLFIFKKGTLEQYSKNDFPLLGLYFDATTDVTSASMIPEEVLIGLISNKNHPQHDQLWSSKIKRESTMKLFRTKVKVTSVNQQVRQTKSTKKLGVQKTVNLEKVTDYMALYKTGYETGFTPELRNAIELFANKSKIVGFPYKNIGIVLDESPSMSGHKMESKNTPRAIAEFTTLVLSKSAINANVARTEKGATDLASSFIELLKNEDSKKPYDAVFFISDGYENQYEGLTDEVVNAYLSESERHMPIFQISPIVGAEMEANVRTLGAEFIKMSVNSPSALIGQMNGRLLDIDTKKWIENQIKILETSNVSRYTKNNVEV